MKKITTFFAAMVFFVAAFAQTAQSVKVKSAASDWKSYETSNYQLSYPKSWRLQEGGLMGAAFYVYSNDVGNGDVFEENINLMVTPRTEGVTLTDLAQQVETTLPSVMGNIEFLESTSFESNGQSFYKMVYSVKLDYYDLKFFQYYTYGKENAYILTFTEENGVDSKVESMGLKVMDSFRLK